MKLSTSANRPAEPNVVPLPGAILVLMLLLVALSHLYPQQAFPLYGTFIGFGLALLAAIAVAANGCSLFRNRLAVACSALGAAWLAWWMLELSRAPVEALGRPAAASMLQGFLVFIAALTCVRAAKSTTPAFPAARLVIATIAALAAIVAAHGLYQKWGLSGWPGTHATLAAQLAREGAGYDPRTQQALMHLLTEGRAGGRFGSANIFAGLMAIALPLMLALAIKRQLRISLRILTILGAIVLFMAIIASGSRGGLLSAVFGALVFAILVFVKLPRNIAATTPILLIPIFILGAADKGAWTFTERWLGSTTIIQRLYYWQTGFNIWSESILLGRGAGAYAIHYAAHRVPGAQETGLAHNWFLQWGAETGAIGLLIFCAWIGLVLYAGALWRNRNGETLLASGALAAIAVALAGGLVEFTLSYREIYLVAAMLLGVTAAEGTAPPATEHREPSPFARVATFAGMLLAAALLVYTLQLKPAMAEYYSENALYAETPRQAVEYYNSALKWESDNPALYESRGLARIAARDWQGTEDLQHALELNPFSARLHETMSRTLAAQSNIPEAIEWQRKAVARHPLDATHQLYLATLLWQSGNENEARKTLANTFELFADDQEETERARLARLFNLEH